MRGGVRRSSVVVGRTEDLDRLRDAVGRAGRARSDCVFVTGEGGIGKTCLLTEAVSEARRRGLVVLVGRAGLAGPVSFGVIAEALRSWTRTSPPGRLHPSIYDRGLQLIM